MHTLYKYIHRVSLYICIYIYVYLYTYIYVYIYPPFIIYVLFGTFHISPRRPQEMYRLRNVYFEIIYSAEAPAGNAPPAKL